MIEVNLLSKIENADQYARSLQWLYEFRDSRRECLEGTLCDTAPEYFDIMTAALQSQIEKLENECRVYEEEWEQYERERRLRVNS